MTLNLTEEQRDACNRGEHVRVSSKELGTIVIVPASEYDLLWDRKELAEVADLSRAAREKWGRENPYEE